MKVQRVYIDTSVIGGCFDAEFAPRSNGLMKDFRLGNFAPVPSEVVAAEIAPAPEEVRAQYAALLEWQREFVELTDARLINTPVAADTQRVRETSKESTLQQFNGQHHG